MTETEWMDCTNPKRMLALLQSKTSDRKLRLFTCACCRRIWHLLIDNSSRRAIELSEQLAEGSVSPTELTTGLNEANEAFQARAPLDPAEAACFEMVVPGIGLTEAAGAVADIAAHASATTACQEGVGYDYYVSAERLAQCRLVRDIFAGPFRHLASDSKWLAWNDTTVRKIAQAIYDERAFDRLPILGDALEDADCDNADILKHCREPGEHVRGCWVVDLLLGKE